MHPQTIQCLKFFLLNHFQYKFQFEAATLKMRLVVVDRAIKDSYMLKKYIYAWFIYVWTNSLYIEDNLFLQNIEANNSNYKYCTKILEML